MAETNWGEIYDQECDKLVCPLKQEHDEDDSEFNNRADAWWASEIYAVQKTIESRRSEASRLKHSLERDDEKARQYRAAEEYKASQPRGLWGQF